MTREQMIDAAVREVIGVRPGGWPGMLKATLSFYEFIHSWGGTPLHVAEIRSEFYRIANEGYCI